jgi:hypothetical protein
MTRLQYRLLQHKTDLYIIRKKHILDRVETYLHYRRTYVDNTAFELKYSVYFTLELPQIL